MAKAFITGGSSYLGIKLIEHFSDFQFTALVHKKLIKYKNVKLLKVDTPEDIMKNFKDEKYDYVFHFATQKYMEKARAKKTTEVFDQISCHSFSNKSLISKCFGLFKMYDSLF